ncbi:hypothetical protein TSAR_007388 [Trichomalopsis sarcophagae]|uniref:Uncharacterized protein n=1 Tax=Trichomalopsis sarcophagae TaxID=543379 RepID=A0A232EYS6_9HYME|nr:hypothetical protein TSAR_007388 [Trichomalopsis sarcophagae]
MKKTYTTTRKSKSKKRKVGKRATTIEINAKIFSKSVI